MEETNSVTVLKGKTDICLTVPHKLVVKTQVKPLVIYKDQEVLTEKLARGSSHACGCLRCH